MWGKDYGKPPLHLVKSFFPLPIISYCAVFFMLAFFSFHTLDGILTLLQIPSLFSKILVLGANQSPDPNQWVPFHGLKLVFDQPILFKSFVF